MTSPHIKYCTQETKPSHGCGFTTVDRYGTETVDTVYYGHEKSSTTDENYNIK